MKNHDCVFSKYCDNYIADSCQGCRNVGKNDQTYISNELSWFGIDENKERKNTMIFTETEKKSYRDHCLPYSSKKTDYTKYSYNTNKIKDVIFNPPATIVLWNDGTKTVVKAGERDIYDPEKGLAMAIAKKFFGNEGNYYNNIRKFVKPYEKKRAEEAAKLAKKNSKKDTTDETSSNGPWMIWTKRYDTEGKFIGAACYHKVYKRKCDASRVAKKLFDGTAIDFVISKTNPWAENGDPTCQE